MSGVRYFILLESTLPLSSGETLCYQKVAEHPGHGLKRPTKTHYRFIRRGTDAKMKSQRGQAGIPNSTGAIALIRAMQAQEETEKIAGFEVADTTLVT